ncbi:MAG: type II toxin-antitoxin system VapB family antitoxin [Chloroflexi bacterium]|nr:type II toxin-antitoxin system VapB family antitoxin [Chloroflexota bacterium]
MVERFRPHGGKRGIVGLYIKREETYRLAQELARLTGESVTVAVTRAVEERLDRVRRQRGVSLADRLLAIGEDCAAHLTEPNRSIDHADLLYDDRGLPR